MSKLSLCLLIFLFAVIEVSFSKVNLKSVKLTVDPPEPKTNLYTLTCAVDVEPIIAHYFVDFQQNKSTIGTYEMWGKSG